MNLIYNKILTFFKPFVVWTAKVYMPFSRKKITGKDYYKWRDSIDVGTVILTKTRGEFSNYINPVEIKHAGIYVGKILDDNICYVLEAVGKGVRLIDLVTFLTTKDVAVGCKPKFIHDKQKFLESIEISVNSYNHLPYDYLFNKGKKALYCFELCVLCLLDACPSIQFKSKEILKGKLIYDHNTFLDANKFEVIFDSRIK